MNDTLPKIYRETSLSNDVSSLLVERIFPVPMGPIEKNKVHERYIIAKNKSDPNVTFPRQINIRLDSLAEVEPDIHVRRRNPLVRFIRYIKTIYNNLLKRS